MESMAGLDGAKRIERFFLAPMPGALARHRFVETSLVLNENLSEATGTAGRLSRRAGPAWGTVLLNLEKERLPKEIRAPKRNLT